MSRILVVEDEEYSLLLIKEILEEYFEGKVSISTAEFGDEALELILEKHPEVVFLDVTLPKIGGWDICSAVRERGINTRIALITGARASGEENEMRPRVDAFIRKPFKAKTITDTAEHLLDIEG